MDEELNDVVYNETTQVELPELLSWNSRSVYDYVEHIVDYDDLEKLGNAINKARLGLFIVTDKINEFDRKMLLAKTEYEREYRRRYLTSNAKTEMQRKIRAELMCEDLENNLLTFTQAKAELTRQANLLRVELETLNTISNNIRQQMKMV